MMKIRTECEPFVAAARAFADTLGPEARASLEEGLAYLETYRGNTCLCDLYKDFAPHSFGFNLLGPADKNGDRQHWFTGGLIYFGPKQTGVDAPQFCVDLEAVMGASSADKPRWSIHT